MLNFDTTCLSDKSSINFFIDVDLKDTHFMCIAGALSASLEVWCPKYEVFQIYLPCVCQAMQGVGSVAFTLCKIKKDLFAFLEPKWEKRQTRHPTQHKSLNYRFFSKHFFPNKSLIYSKLLCHTYIKMFVFFYFFSRRTWNGENERFFVLKHILDTYKENKNDSFYS